MYLALVIGIILIMAVIDLVVTLVNYRHRSQPIPENVRGIYDQEKYEKWLRHSMETMRFGLLVKAVNLVLLLALLAFGGFGWLERLTNSWFAHPILQTLAFLGVFLLFSSLVDLPFEYYSTFVLEEKYGFNKTTLKTFVLDQLKNLLLAVVLGGALVAALMALYLAFQDRLWLFILLGWALLVLVMTVLFFLNKYLIKIFNKLTPLPEGSLKERIEALAAAVGFKVTSISEMDASRRSTKLNAFFTGLGRNREVVLYDTLIEKMDEDSILAVLAHELGHAIHKDTLKILLQQVLIFGIYAVVIGFVLQSDAFAQAFGLSGAHFGFSLILFSVLISPLELLLSLPMNAYARKAEYAADAFAASHTHKDYIHSALVTLAQENLANLNPHPLFVLLHYNHPPLSQRLRAIQEG